MFKNYLKTAYRSLLRYRSATLIKLSGLSLGMACCLLIVIYISDELSYNRFNLHYRDIYRVNFVKHGDGETRVMAGTPNVAGPAIQKDLPQVAATARMYQRGGILEVKDGLRRRLQEQGIYFADNGLFDVFTFHFVQGSAVGALTEPNSILLTREMATLESIRRLWDSYFPERIFEYSFLDENINGLYNAQENLSKLVGYFALIAIFICSIGLSSLASFMGQQRTREMGIRKVLGATVANITGLLFKDFFRLLVIALVIALPLAWWLMDQWLHDFAYRINLSWWMFAVAGLFAVLIALLTVGVQGGRVARVNIVKSLRNF